jgi:hypothetical protein
MKGWRTIAINVGIAAGTAALGVLAGIDWTKEVGGTAAVIIIAAVNIATRVITTGPIGQK